MQDNENSNALEKWKRLSDAGQSRSLEELAIEPSSGGVNSDTDITIDNAVELQEQIGKDLASLFKDNQVHPVLIFGSKGSGKTSLIASLFKYIRDNENASASIELADDIFPKEDARWNNSIEWAQELFYKKVFELIDNTAPTATQEAMPFFIPVRLTEIGGEEKVLAFLEGKGEWYQAEEDLSKKPYKKFKGLIQSLLLNFNDPVTVIYVAPYVAGSSNDGDNAKSLKQRDIGLLGVLNEYQMYRRAYQHQDNHLLLVTKWDAYAQALASESFLEPTDEEIEAVLSERYRLTWNKYVNLHFTKENQNKSVSTYSSGFMEGRAIAPPAKEDVDLISHYPRKLWDWLYEKATGRILYPDVRPKKPSFLEKLINFLRGHG